MMKKAANILYVSPFGHMGGGEMSVLTIINNLDRSRFRPFIISYEDGPFIKRARESGIDVTVIKRGGPFSEVSVISGIARFIKDKDINLVHVNSLDIRAGIAASLSGVPYLGHLRVIYPFTWRDRLFVRMSAATAAVSEAVVSIFCSGDKSIGDKFVVMPNMVDISSGTQPAPIRSEFNIPADAKLIGMAGRIDPMKGHVLFIEAASIIRKSEPRSKFLVIGKAGNSAEEAYLKGLKDSVKKAGLEDVFVFTGFRPDILKVMASLDVLVVPSRMLRTAGGIISEGFGRVAIEGMAAGVPVVSTKVGGLPEIIEDGVCGLLVEPDDPEAMARAVVRILNDPANRSSLVSAAKKRFGDMYSVRAIARIENTYERLIGKYAFRKRGRAIKRFIKEIVLNIYFVFRLPFLMLLKILFRSPDAKAGTISRILVIRPDRLGDLVLSLPLIDSLKAAYPSARIDLLVRPYLAELASLIKHADEVIAYKGAADAVRNLPGREYDVAIDMYCGYKIESAVVAIASRAPVKIGFKGGFREVLLTDAIDPSAGVPKDMAGLCLELLKPLGVKPETAVPRLGTAQRREAHKPLSIAIHPGGYYSSQRWPADRFASVARLLAEKYAANVTAIGGPDDREAVDTILRLAGKAGVKAVFPSIRGLVEALSECDLLICNNSGPLHLASALGLPTVSTMGPTDPVLWWPNGDDQEVLRNDAECSPCSRGECSDRRCLDTITAEEVFDAARSILERRYGVK